MPHDDDGLLLDYLHGQLTAAQEAALVERLRTDRDFGRRLQQLAAEESVIGEWARADAGNPRPSLMVRPRRKSR